jgi:PAS domain S-box-containing protein
MENIFKTDLLKPGILKILISLSIPVAFLVAIIFFFNSVYNELLNYSNHSTKTDKVYAGFRNLGNEINIAATGNSKLLVPDKELSGSSLLYTDSQRIVKHLELLKANVKDTINVRIVRQLNKEILAELPWLLGIKDLDSGIQIGTPSHFATLHHINLLIDSGIKRTSFLLDSRRKEFENSILDLLAWIIIFFILSVIFLVYTSYHFYKERSKTKIKGIELETNEKRFRTLVSKSADIIAVFDKNMAPIYHSPSAERFLGYDCEENKNGIEMDDVHPDDKTRLEHLINEVNSEPDKVVDSLFRVKHKSGTYLWLEGTFVNLFHDPEVQGILANLRDISERKKAEEELLISIKEISDYKYALNESSIVAITDQKGIIRHVNENFCTISGYSQEELIGQDHRIINSGFHSKEFIAELWKTIANGNIWKGELKNKAKNGSYYWVDTTIIPFLNNQSKPYQYVAIRADITKRKEGEENLRQSLKELSDYKYALDESAIVAITDQKGIIKHVNENFCTISGYTKEELIGQDHRIINSGFHSKEFIAELWKTIANGNIWKGELKNKAKNGTYYWVDTTIIPFLNNQSKPYQYVAIRADITKRKEGEEYLSQSLKELSDYKYALDESAIVAITDQKGIIKHVNQNFCDISGFTIEELVGQDHRIINSGFHSRQFMRDLWKTIANGGIWKGELKNKAKGGKYYWVDTTIIPFLNPEGKPYQYVAIRSDITSRKNGEEEVQHKTRQINDILDRIDEGFIALDKEFRYTHANKKIGKMTGRDPGSLIGKYVWDEFPEAVGSITYKAFEQAYKEQRYICEVDYYAPYDLWQENHIYPSEDGIVVFIRDISSQKKQEQEISSAYKRLSFHFNNSPLGVMEWEPSGNILQWSEQAETIFGWSAEELIGKNVSNMELSVPENAALDEQLTLKLLNGEIERVIGSSKNKTKSGRLIYTEWYNSVLKDDEGKVISIVSLINDVSARKEAELLIQRLNEELESKVVIRTEQLEQANRDLEAFSYSVSHDLRAPLRAVNGFSMMLQELYRDKLDERADRLMGTIVSSTVSMGMLIDDLLKFSRLGRKELTIQPVNMEALLRDCLQEIGLSNPELNAEIEIETLPPCLGDRLLIRQVWMNLIINAIKYSSTVDSPRIVISFKETEHTVTYLVNDNGVGFDMQYYDKLFGVFQRLHRQSEFEGTGIGLALVKRIIDKHNGKVWAEGEISKGATFYFTLSKYKKSW